MSHLSGASQKFKAGMDFIYIFFFLLLSSEHSYNHGVNESHLGVKTETNVKVDKVRLIIDANGAAAGCTVPSQLMVLFVFGSVLQLF